MIVLNAKIAPIMQYKCEYLDAFFMYGSSGVTYKIPDISDFNLKETQEFLMYVPVEPASCSTASLPSLFDDDDDDNKASFRSYADKICAYAMYAEIRDPSNCQLCFDVYDFDNISFGGTIINNVGVLCTKNIQFYHLLLSVVTYELYARLDFFKHFKQTNIKVIAKHALEWLVSIKVCAQILCGLLWINSSSRSSSNQTNGDCVLIEHLLNLCIQIVKADFFPSYNALMYRFVFDMAQYFKHFVSTETALVTDVRVPINTTNFIIHNHLHKCDTVDMFSFYVFQASFLKRMCNTLNIQYMSEANSQICFCVKFLNANQNTDTIIDHIIQYVNKNNVT